MSFLKKIRNALSIEPEKRYSSTKSDRVSSAMSPKEEFALREELFGDDSYQDHISENKPVKVTAHDLSVFLSQVGDVISSNSSAEVQSENESWLIDKKNNFSGKDYIEQLEKNAIYAVESISLALPSLVTFIITDHELDSDFIFQHIGNGQSLARDKVGFHLNYLGKGCSGCISHDDHSRYVGLLEIKKSGDIDKYIDELEFWCRFYRSMQTFTMHYLQYFVENMDAFKVYKDISEVEVRMEVEKYIKFYSNNSRVSSSRHEASLNTSILSTSCLSIMNFAKVPS